MTSQSCQTAGHGSTVTVSPRNDILTGYDCGDSIAHGVTKFSL